MYIVVGLGNPTIEYKNTRHNVGRRAVMYFHKKNDFSLWKQEKKVKVLTSNGVIEKEGVELLLPETFMNISGKAVAFYITSKKKAEALIVLYDDIDLPLGTIKISFGRGSGGHRGIESIIKSIRTKDFVRIRIGISPVTPKGKIRKPRGEKKVLDFLMSNNTKKELEILKKVSKKVDDALKLIILEGRERAMNEYN